MFSVVKCVAVCIVVLGVGQVAAAEEALELQNGSYEFRLITPQMAEGKRDITLPAEVEVKDDQVVIRTQGMLGNKMTLSGMASEGTMKVGMTGVEKSSILSFHYIGQIKSKQEAEGKFHCFLDGKAALSGKWVLAKKETP